MLWNGFKELQPTLRSALGQTPTEALGRAIHDIDFERALVVLNRATANGNGRDTFGESMQ
jgi:hypothetical protein